MTDLPPETPCGPLEPVTAFNSGAKADLIQTLTEAPDRLRTAVDGLSDKQLETRYKNWSIRQIVHHLADSHLHSYIRFKWTLTEDTPVIKAYEEGDWVQLDDSRTGALEPSLALLDGLHRKWVQVLELMTPGQYERSFVHPQSGETVSLWTALNYYPWHARHHTAQIVWLRGHHQW